MEKLFFELCLYSKFDISTKIKIFQASFKNDLRYLNKTTRSQKKLCNIITNNRINKDKKYFDIIIKKIGIDFPKIKLNKNNWTKNILYINDFLSNKIGLNEWESSIVLNIWLAKNGYCPLLHYSFNSWHTILSEKHLSKVKVTDLVEFSTVYLYRIATIKNNLKINYFANGSHNYIFLFKKNNMLKKIPKSIAAKKFINDQEVLTIKLLQKSQMKDYIPRLINYNKNKIITRQYILGESGHNLLKSNFFNEYPYAKEELKNFFDIYKKIKIKYKINLDIHPGNFIWSFDKKQWFFIDTGPIPIIGSEYFPLNNFNNYFKKIWIERYDRIKKIPIRSVYLN